MLEIQFFWWLFEERLSSYRGKEITCLEWKDFQRMEKWCRVKFCLELHSLSASIWRMTCCCCASIYHCLAFNSFLWLDFLSLFLLYHLVLAPSLSPYCSHSISFLSLLELSVQHLLVFASYIVISSSDFFCKIIPRIAVIFVSAVPCNHSNFRHRIDLYP